MIRITTKSLITSLSIAVLTLSGCTSRGYQRSCDWCDDASQAQLKNDIVECNAIAEREAPNHSITVKTGRIVTSHGSTTCTTNKRGDRTCTTGSDYTYQEEEERDNTNYQKRKAVFDKCADGKTQNYRPKTTSTKSISSEASKSEDNKFHWNLETPPEKIDFAWTLIADNNYISLLRNNIQANEGRRIFWTLLSNNEGNGDLRKGSLPASAIVQIEIDCPEHKMRLLVVYEYPEPMGKGKLIRKMRIPSDSAQGVWKELPPFSSEHSKYLCAAMT